MSKGDTRVAGERRTRRKVVHFIRHAQSANVAQMEQIIADYGIPPRMVAAIFSRTDPHPAVLRIRELEKDPKNFDSPLTDLGRAQAAELRDTLGRSGDAARIERVLCSPASRTLETAEIALAPVIARLRAQGKPVLATETWREFGGAGSPYNHRRPPTELSEGWTHKGFDLSEIPELDELAAMPKRESHEAAFPRFWRGMMELMELPEKELALVTHGGIFGLLVVKHPQVIWVGEAVDPQWVMPTCSQLTLEVTHTEGDLHLTVRVVTPETRAVTKTVHFFRHGEMAANVHAIAYTQARGLSLTEMVATLFDPVTDPSMLEFFQSAAKAGLFDTVLTAAGKDQARALGKRLKDSGIADQIERVVSSSLNRAMETAAIALEGPIARLAAEGKPVLVTDLWREYGGDLHPFSFRPSRSVLERNFRHRPFDFSALDQHDPLRGWPGREPPSHSVPRGWDALMQLVRLKETVIAVASHGAFGPMEVFGHPQLRWVTDDRPPEHLSNCALVSFELTYSAGDDFVEAKILPSPTPKSQL